MTREEQYQHTVTTLRKLHGELIVLENDGKFNSARENPTLIGEYLVKLRLNSSLLFSFMNDYIDLLNEALKGTSEKRQGIFMERLALPKSSPTGSEAYAREMTRVDEANVKIVENELRKIRNEYERYNSICMTLQSRMKEFDTERRIDGR